MDTDFNAKSQRREGRNEEMKTRISRINTNYAGTEGTETERFGDRKMGNADPSKQKGTGTPRGGTRPTRFRRKRFISCRVSHCSPSFSRSNSNVSSTFCGTGN